MEHIKIIKRALSSDKKAEVFKKFSSSLPFNELASRDLSALIEQIEVLELDESGEQQLPNSECSFLFYVNRGTLTVKDSSVEPRLVREGEYFNVSRFVDKINYRVILNVECSVELYCFPSPIIKEAMESQTISKYLKLEEDKFEQSVSSSPNSWLLNKLSMVINSKPITVKQTDSIQSAALLMKQKCISSVLIIEDDQLSGIVTDRDLRNRVVAQGLNMQLPVKQIMTQSPKFGNSNQTLFDAMRIMNNENINHLPVVEKSTLRPLGIVTGTDILRQQRNDIFFVVNELSRAQNEAELTACAWQLIGHRVRHHAKIEKSESLRDALYSASNVITNKLILFFQQSHGAAPETYVWLTSNKGISEDQTNTNEQCNALLLLGDADSNNDDYFEKMASYVCFQLAECGFGLSANNQMATNPILRTSLDKLLSDIELTLQSQIESSTRALEFFSSAQFSSGDKCLFDRLNQELSKVC